MPEQRGTLYRASDGLIAGVCGGFAQRWGVDTGVLRFAVVALTVATGGLFALVYIALWLVLPLRDEGSFTVDVSPDSVASYTYGARSERGKHVNKEKTHVDYSHMPPQSPDAAAAAARMRASELQAQGPMHQAEGAVALGLGFGTILAVAGMAFLLSSFSTMLHPIQFWPLILVALGIIRMVVPRLRGYRIESFMMGFTAFCLGIVLLVCTTGMSSMHFTQWISQGWPIVSMLLGCGLLWRATHLNGFALCVLVLIAAFCVAGIVFCSDPGPALSVIADQPFTKGFPTMGVH